MDRVGRQLFIGMARLARFSDMEHEFPLARVLRGRVRVQGNIAVAARTGQEPVDRVLEMVL
jgi:hypothetical protein